MRAGRSLCCREGNKMINNFIKGNFKDKEILISNMLCDNNLLNNNMSFSGAWLFVRGFKC